MKPSFLEQFYKYKSSLKPALVCGSVTLTYAELYERSLTLARRLRSLGVGLVSTEPAAYDIFEPPSSECSPWVVIVTDRSINAVIGTIAAMMAGGAYVLIDQASPEEYVKSVTHDTNAVVVLRDGCFDIGEEIGDFTCALPKENEIACAVFTSGSTGKPKGAVLEHRVISEMLHWQTDYMNPADLTATASYAPLGFVAAVWELFFPLANGLTLHMLDEATRHDLFALENYIEENRISYMFLPPNVAGTFTEIYKGDALKYLRVAGGRLKACGEPKGYEIMYHLGMAENGGSVTFKPIRKAMPGDIPIGRAWNKTKLRLDTETGEMIVSGPSLFRGYLARRDETKHKLIDGEYHSGDLAETDKNGELVHIGRSDFAVKIRDMKVNPAQIEQVLSKSQGVCECCVTSQILDGENALIGWFTGDADESSLRAELSLHLPEHMIPVAFARLEQLPTVTNGKIDRLSLHYTPRRHEKKMSPDMSEAEQDVAWMFERVLNLPPNCVGAADNFLQLGGDSLKFMRLQAEIARTLSINVPYAELFKNPTVCGIAAILRNRTGFERIPSAVTMEAYPLSAPMRQMWLLWRTGQDCGKYTVSIKCRFSGELDKSRIIEAFSELTRRNTILRSQFVEKCANVVQVIKESVEVVICEHPRTEFDLTAAPIFDITLTDNLLTFTTHHIIADATGLRVLMEDFWTLYGGGSPQNSVQPHDIAIQAQHRDISADEDYWRKVFSDKVPTLTLPYDFARPKRLTSALRESVSFDETESASLREYAASHGATLFQLFLSAYAFLLSKRSGGDSVVVGVPFSGREHPDTARTVGMLVRTLPVKLDINGMNFEDTLLHVRNRFIAAWEHQELSFERLTEIIDYPRTASRNPFYDVMINYAPMARPLPNVNGLCPEVLRSEYPGALFDLVLDLREDEDGLSAVFTYADELWKPETMRSWLAALKKLLLTGECTLDDAHKPSASDTEKSDASFETVSPQLDALLHVWRETLNTDTVLPGDDFFKVGGTSLAAIRIEAALFEKGWLLSASDIFQNPELCEMAALMLPSTEDDWDE